MVSGVLHCESEAKPQLQGNRTEDLNGRNQVAVYSKRCADIFGHQIRYNLARRRAMDDERNGAYRSSFCVIVLCNLVIGPRSPPFTWKAAIQTLLHLYSSRDY